MQIYILSRIEAEHISGTIDTSHIWISITSPGSQASLAEHPDCHGVLRLEFEDLDLGNYFVDVDGIFTEKMAEEVLEFVEQHMSNVDIICVHCEAGISRSAAVASALAVWLNGEDKTTLSGTHMPNGWVRMLMMREIRKRV
jgi:predicted protein tyrosine phosphatase